MTRIIDTLLEELTENSSDTSSPDKYMMETDSLVTLTSAPSAELGYCQLDEEHIHGAIHPEQFAGCKVFAVDPETFYKCRLGKRQYARYEQYVGNDSVGENIRGYGRSRHGNKGIILVNNVTGAMVYLRHPGKYKLPKVS